MTESAASVEHVTCLGCGCACDDITVTVRGGPHRECRARLRARRALVRRRRGACAASWSVARRVARRALDEAAALLCRARSPLVYLAADVSCEAQRAAVAASPTCWAGALDSVTSVHGARRSSWPRNAAAAPEQRSVRSGTAPTCPVLGSGSEQSATLAMRLAMRPIPKGCTYRTGRAGRTVIGWTSVSAGRRPITTPPSRSRRRGIGRARLTRAAVLGRAVA